jgi:ATP-dependent Lhr-like helicase
LPGIEQIPGGFSTVYPVLPPPRGNRTHPSWLLVAGLGAAQFAQSGAVDLLRDARVERDDIVTVTLSATDPANPYGVLIPWPAVPQSESRSSRTAGARVVLIDGRLAAWIGRADHHLVVSLPENEPERSAHGRALAKELTRQGWLIEEINGLPAAADPSSQYLIEAGFTATAHGLQYRLPKKMPEGDAIFHRASPICASPERCLLRHRIRPSPQKEPICSSSAEPSSVAKPPANTA